MRAEGADRSDYRPVTLQTAAWSLSGVLPIIDNQQLLSWRLANAKGRDILQLWLMHLLANTQQPTHSRGLYRGRDEKVEQFDLAPIDDAVTLLNDLHRQWQQGLQEPSVLHSDWLPLYLSDPTNEKKFRQIWDDSFNQRGLRYDPYIDYCFQQMPDPQTTMDDMDRRYAMLKNTLVQTQLEDVLDV